MKRLGSRVNLIPVIAKADTLTPINLDKFKQNVSFQAVYKVAIFIHASNDTRSEKSLQHKTFKYTLVLLTVTTSQLPKEIVPSWQPCLLLSLDLRKM